MRRRRYDEKIEEEMDEDDWEERRRMNGQEEEDVEMIGEMSSDESDSEEDEDHDDGRNETDGLDQRSGDWCSLWTLVILVGSALGVLGFLLALNWTNPGPVPFPEALASLRSIFPRHSIASWKTLNASLSRHVTRNESLEKPAVIMLVGHPNKIEAFHRRLVDVILGSEMSSECPPYSPLSNELNTDKLKIHLNKFLLESRERGGRCMTIRNVDEMPPSLVSFLQSLVDDVNARFKDMIYILSVEVSTLDNSESIISERDAETISVEQMRSKWEELVGYERFAALETRLFVNVISVV